MNPIEKIEAFTLEPAPSKTFISSFRTAWNIQVRGTLVPLKMLF